MSDGSWRTRSESGSRPTVIVSACLVGVRCNHEGSCTDAPAVAALASRHRLVPVCPETAGGLPTPRVAAERQPDGSVRAGDGRDVTDAYVRGAAHAVRLAAATGATHAVLKARSPSCGVREIYDGSFSRVRIRGRGVTAEALENAGVSVYDEEDVAEGRTPL